MSWALTSLDVVVLVGGLVRVLPIQLPTCIQVKQKRSARLGQVNVNKRRSILSSTGQVQTIHHPSVFLPFSLFFPVRALSLSLSLSFSVHGIVVLF